MVPDGVHKKIVEVTVTRRVVSRVGAVLQVDEAFGHQEPEVWHEPAPGSNSVKKTK